MKRINAAIAAMLCAVLIFCGCVRVEVTETDDVKTSADVAEINETISIFALGDNLLHMPVINSGKQNDGTYEYSHLFELLQPNIKNADIAVIGQETVFGGEKFGYSGYPLFNSPSDMGKTLVSEGFDVVLHASNHVLDKWAEGIENTLAFWKGYPDITVLGINDSEEDKQSIDIKEVKGARIALLNYTYGTNGLVLPRGKEYLVNYIDENKMQTDIVYAEENTDFTIAFMHWGTEYSIKPDDFQKNLAQKMCEWGVDLIIGSHPHVIEPVEWIESENGNRMLVYYSLGNFVSRQKEARNLLGGAADVKLKFDGEKVTIEDYAFVPIVTHYDTTYTRFAVYPLDLYTDEMAAQHGVTPHDGAVSLERWKNMITETFEGYDINVLEE